MIQVCEGAKTKDEMLVQSIEQYKDMFVMAKREFNKVIEVNLLALLVFLLVDMTVLQSVRRYIEGAGAPNAGNDEGGPGRGGGAPRGRGRGRGRGNGRGDGDDSDSAPPAGGRSRGRGAPRRPRSPSSFNGESRVIATENRPTLVITDNDPPQPRPRSSLRETVPQAGSSNHAGRLPNCNCGVPAGKKRVVQQSAREGKQFYACAKGACAFFKWIEGEDDQQVHGNTTPTPVIPAKRAIGNNYPVSEVHPATRS